MKNQFMVMLCFIAFMLCTFSHALSAQNTIVRVRGGVSTVFTTLDEALTDQANGDYFNLSGGVFTTTKAIQKGIHIVGAGYNASTAATGATGVTRIASNIYIYTGADNGSIEGVEINSYVYFGNGSTVMQVTGFLIKRCWIGPQSSGIYGYGYISAQSSCTVTNLTVINCVLGIVYGASGDIKSSYFANNIIHNYVNMPSTSITNLFDHNIFFGSDYSVYSAYYCTFTNNIFQRASFYNANYCIFQNNHNVPNPLGNNTVSNSVNQTWDNVFNSLGTTTNGYYTFSLTNNYTLKTGSVCIGTGTNGSDMGIYGGDFAWKANGIPSNPHIVSKNISSTTNATTGKLHVEVTVQAQDH